MAEYSEKLIKIVDYKAMKAAFDEKYKETMQLVRNGETHLDNLAEGFHEADGVIFRMPNADVAPVVHGRWKEGKSLEKCSICGKKGFPDWRYCPNCGAKMDLE